MELWIKFSTSLEYIRWAAEGVLLRAFTHTYHEAGVLAGVPRPGHVDGAAGGVAPASAGRRDLSLSLPLFLQVLFEREQLHLLPNKHRLLLVPLNLHASHSLAASATEWLRLFIQLERLQVRTRSNFKDRFVKLISYVKKYKYTAIEESFENAFLDFYVWLKLSSCLFYWIPINILSYPSTFISSIISISTSIN